MTKEQEQKLKQAKIERLNYLRDQYRRMEVGASPAEVTALRMEGAVINKRLEVAGRRGRSSIR